jgi:Tfp pilus assembly protein PilF
LDVGVKLAQAAKAVPIWLLATVGCWSAAAAQPASPAVTAGTVVQQDYEALFQQMYKNPSNLEVSFKFAEQAVKRGDYEAAIGALERMLFFNPNLPRVKLELGVLYFKLGSYELARSYFQEAIKAPDAPDDIRAQVHAYLTEIDRRLARYEFSVFATAGFRYQTNANLGPSSLLVRALGQDAILNSAFGKQPDWNFFQTLTANYAYKLNTRGDAIEASFLAYNSRQFKLDQYNLGLIELVVGPRFAIGQNASVKLYGIGDQVWLGDADYFSAGGGGVSARTTVGDLGLLEAFVEQRHRDFRDSTNFPTASQQTGELLSTGVTSDIRFGALHWTTRLGYDQNRAVFDYNAYRRYSIDMAFPYEFSLPMFGERHQFVITPTVGFSWANYYAPNPIIDPFRFRTDREQRYGAIFDAQVYKNLGVRTQLQYTKINSTLPNYTTDNFAVSIGPTARF